MGADFIALILDLISCRMARGEVLAKLVCHNLCCLIQEQEERPATLAFPGVRSAITCSAPQNT